MRRLAIAWAVALLVLPFLPSAASAHPLGNFTVNHLSRVTVASDAIRVRYVLDLAEIPTLQETQAGQLDGIEHRLADALALTVDGRAASLALRSSSLERLAGQAGLATLRVTLDLEAPAPRDGARIEYRDATYAGRIGWHAVVFGGAFRAATVPADDPTDELRSYPNDPNVVPPDVTDASATVDLSASVIRTASGLGGLPRFAIDTSADVLSSFLRTGPVDLAALVAALLVAMMLGALHALGPGHGKTITAAYLVGSGARRAQATAIGVAVSLMHTASVLTLGLVFLVLARSFPPERVYPWLEVATGLVALGLGAYLVTVRVRARRRGDDPWHGHTHDASGDHEHPHEHDHARPVTPRSLAALAVAGGILPSPTAFVVLLGAVRAHRIAYGLGLILAFSVGLATALVLVGVFAIRARSSVVERLRGRWASLVPVASATVILGFGVFFVTRGTTRIL